MKTTNRIFACLLIVVMLASMLCVGANAAVTVKSKDDTTVYTYYKVLDIETNADASAILYTWATTYTLTDDATMVTTSADGYVTVVNATKFAKKVLDDAPAALTTGTINATTAGVSYTFPSDGYYVMKSSAGTQPFAFTIFNGEILASSYGTIFTSNTITEKSDLPTIEKTVDDSHVGITDTVTYTITVTAEANGENYVVTDTLPTGLSVEATGVTVDGLTKGTHYDVNVSGQTVTVTFKNSYITTLAAQTKIYVRIQATVNDDIAIYEEGTNINKATLNYGDSMVKVSNEVPVYSYKITLTKKGTNNSGTVDHLAGAKFVLSKTESGTTTYATLSGSDPTYTITGWVATQGAADTITTQNTDIEFKGLGDGQYSLIETDAPAGYLVAAAEDITISTANANVTVTNTTGNKLPETGGMGTTVFYAVGGILVLGALVVLLMKKRTVTE